MVGDALSQDVAVIVHVCSVFFSGRQTSLFHNKVCITNVMGECSKQQDKENMEERKRGKWQRTKWGRNRESIERGREKRENR